MSEYFEKIDDYINNNLSDEDKLAFETAMLSDEKLKHAVENYHLIKKLSGSLIEDETRETLRNLVNSEKLMVNRVDNNLNKNFSLIKYLKYAAVACFLGLVSYFTFNSLNNYSIDQFVADSHEDPELSINRSAEIVEGTRIDSAIHYYSLNKFDNASDFLNPLPENDSLATIGKRYLAHIKLEQKEYEASIGYFLELINHPSLSKEAKRNISLCYLALGDMDNTRKYFDETDKVQGWKEDERKKILKYLND